MPDFQRKDPLALVPRGRRGAPGGKPERPPLGPSEEPLLRDVAVYVLWLSGIALIVASMFM